MQPVIRSLGIITAGYLAFGALTVSTSYAVDVNSIVQSNIHSAVHSGVNSAVHSSVNSAVHSSVNSAVHSGVNSAVHSSVNSAVHSGVNSGVRSSVKSAVRPGVQRPRDVQSKTLLTNEPSSKKLISKEEAGVKQSTITTEKLVASKKNEAAMGSVIPEPTHAIKVAA